jgi:hypothetical protein
MTTRRHWPSGDLCQRCIKIVAGFEQEMIAVESQLSELIADLLAGETLITR